MGAKVTDEAVLKAAERANGQAPEDDPQLVTLSTGVVLRVTRVSQSLLADMLAELAPPAVPVVWVESKGREEENPEDPDYLAAKQAHEARLAKAMSDATVVLGTALESKPESVPGDDDTRWLQQMAALGKRFNSDVERYLAWVKYVAAPTAEDFNLIWKAVGRQSGVTEADARDAGRRFPRRAGRNRHR